MANSFRNVFNKLFGVSYKKFFHAVENDNLEIVEQYIRKNRDNDKVNRINPQFHGWTALARAAAKGHTAIVNALLTHRHIDVNVRAGGGSALHYAFYAFKRDHTDSVTVLLAHQGIDVNMLNAFNQHP